MNSANGPLSLFFEVSGDVLPPAMQVHDFAVLAALFVALREGRPMHVEGVVTETMLRNLEEFQEAWALWRPDYRPIQITADKVVVGESATPRKGVFAFSTGVDGTFALLRHHEGRAGLRTAQPTCAMLVHGFDTPLKEQEAFDRVHRNATEVLRSLDVPLVTVRTNWKTDACKDWGMEFMAGLAACLHQFHGLASVGVLGADEDYAHLELPWGSNPITNQLLSGGTFQLHTEGGGFTRTDRVRLICDYPEIGSKLHVCWEGPTTGANCGRCEKCIRTQMNFMAKSPGTGLLRYQADECTDSWHQGSEASPNCVSARDPVERKREWRKRCMAVRSVSGDREEPAAATQLEPCEAGPVQVAATVRIQIGQAGLFHMNGLPPPGALVASVLQQLTRPADGLLDSRGLPQARKVPVTGRNCGKCEKCTRTQMNFLAVGQEPLCFSGRPTQAQIIGIDARKRVQIAYGDEILDSARKHGARGPWVKALATSIAKYKALLPLRPALEPTKAIGRRAWNKAVRLVKERVAGRSQSAQ